MIYFDNAATTAPYKEALETYITVSEKYFFNTASIHQSGKDAARLLEAARNQILDLMDLKSYDLVFTASATESNNIAIQSMLKRKKQFGNTVLTSELEHPSIVNVLEEMKQDGFNVKYIDTNDDGTVNLEHLKSMLDSDVVFVTVMALNNIVGSVQPIKEITKILKDYPKVHFHVDATQAIGKADLDYNGVDTISISAHKFNGVKGIGGLFIRDLATMRPVLYGGGHEYNVRSGTVNLPGITAMAKALRLTLGEARDVNKRLSQFNQKIRESVEDLKFIRLQPKAAPYIVNMSFVGAKGEVVVNALSKRGIAVSTTSACASKLATLNETLLALGNEENVIEGSIRISMGRSTTEEDVNKLIAALKEVYEELGDVLK